MTRIKKWIYMLVLIIISPIICKAQTYTTNNSFIPEEVYQTFYNYFGPTKSYKYFSYNCTYGSSTRNCYYGIDTDNNYYNIYYVQDGYYYNQIVQTGTDNNFQLNGTNYFEKGVDINYIILVGGTFIFCIYIFNLIVLRCLDDK